MMAAVVVTAILAAAAYPAYSGYVRRGWLAEGTTVLQTYAQRMERAYDSNGNYGVASCAVTVPASTARWTLTCALQAAGQGYLATLTGQGAIAGFTYTLDNAGTSRTTRFAGATTTSPCWLVRGTEC